MTDTEKLILYAVPGSCSRVLAIVLEELALEFETVLVRFMSGEHKSAAFKKKNPKGKVPALAIHGAVLTETVAIIQYLHQSYPAAAILPLTSNRIHQAEHIADLCFAATALHPTIARLRVPFFVAGEDHAETVWRFAVEHLSDPFSMIDARLKSQAWWYGDNWSAMDAYIFWAYGRAEESGFPVADYPEFTRHAEQMMERPAVNRSLERDDLMFQQLKKEGLVFPIPKFQLKT